MKKLTINVPIFNVPIVLLKTDEWSKLKNWFSTYFEQEIELPDRYADGVTYVANGKITLGFLTNCTSQTALHESLHAVFGINSIIGLEYNEEIFCYLLEWLYPIVEKFCKDV